MANSNNNSPTRSSLEIDHSNDTTSTTTDTAILCDTHDETIHRSYFPQALHHLDQLATTDIPEDLPSPEPQSTIP